MQCKYMSILSQISTTAAAQCQRSNFIHLDEAAPKLQFIHTIFFKFHKIFRNTVSGIVDPEAFTKVNIMEVITAQNSTRCKLT